MKVFSYNISMIGNMNCLLFFQSHSFIYAHTSVFDLCCESDSKLEKLKFAETVKIGAQIVLSRARF